MQALILNVLGRLLAGLAGLVAGFFVAFNAVFSDVFGVGGMAAAVGYVAVSYAVLGFVFGLVARDTGLRWAIWLAPPGLVLVLFSLLDGAHRMPYIAAVMVAVVTGSLAGAWVGRFASIHVARMRHRHSSGGGAPA